MLENKIKEYKQKLKSFPLEELRNQAFEKFQTQGFPEKNNEEWKFSNIQNVLNQEFNLNLSDNNKLDIKIAEKYFLNEDSYRLTFVNGIFNPELSVINKETFTVLNLSEALKNKYFTEIITKNLNASQNFNEHFFALNTTLLHEGSFIEIKKNTNAEKPVQILYFSTIENAFFNIRNLIVLEKSSEIKIIEKHINLTENQNFTNSVSEIFVGDNSILDYYKIQNDSQKSNLIDTTSITQGRDSLAKVHTFSLGGNFTRNNLNFYQKGENSNSILKGITLTNNHQQIDNHTLVDHFVPNCESHELYRGIFDGNSKGIFNGKIIVDREAQKTNAFQQNNNLLLSEKASINTKPQLEIFADDVKCSHGCTVGQLDEDAMFYLQARGIPKKEAKALLTLAFSTDVLESIEIEEIQKIMSKEIAKKLGVEIDLEF